MSSLSSLSQSLFHSNISLCCRLLRLLVQLLPGLTSHHTATSYRLEELLNLRGAVDELMGPELEGWVLDQLDEGDQKTPGVGSVYNQTLQQNPGLEQLKP